ncbi:hypothetical protein HNR61_004351 [Actinomadura namibiensis]|uniref:Uncharacterized protein n=1 Tax=Actinomadura namibiensis TaxID=182080 RepID=A0A7W3QMM2_ACTNM|nr:hypothetical protein [Actinomadura namibiensis]
MKYLLTFRATRTAALLQQAADAPTTATAASSTWR